MTITTEAFTVRPFLRSCHDTLSTKGGGSRASRDQAYAVVCPEGVAA
ncbi:hypothetical protein ACFXKR_29365 [Streptomyces violascens]